MNINVQNQSGTLTVFEPNSVEHGLGAILYRNILVRDNTNSSEQWLIRGLFSGAEMVRCDLAHTEEDGEIRAGCDHHPYMMFYKLGESTEPGDYWYNVIAYYDLASDLNDITFPRLEIVYG